MLLMPKIDHIPVETQCKRKNEQTIMCFLREKLISNTKSCIQNQFP